MNRTILLALAVWPLALQAQDLRFPSNAVLTATESGTDGQLALPVEPWRDGTLPAITLEGDVTHRAWRIDAGDLSSLQILRPLREQLRNQGFDVVFDCAAQVCGGFDFRFELPILLPPAMQVDLAKFHALSATDGAGSGAMILASAGAEAGFVQVSQVTPPGQARPAAESGLAPLVSGPFATTTGDLATLLDTAGRAVLDGVSFGSGSDTLAPGGDEALAAVADYMARFSDRSVALVGHTDASGSLEANIALSKRRARAVLERLATSYGIDRNRMEAEGMGYLAPLASNLTPDGRALNRRVEVILTSTDP